MGQLRCPACGGTESQTDPFSNDVVCANPLCFALIQENRVVSEVQFQDCKDGTVAACGQKISWEQNNGISKGESREATLQKGHRILSDIAGGLNLMTHLVEQGKRILLLAVQRGFSRGRLTRLVAAACLYLVCRRARSPHLLVDFSDVLQTSVKRIGQVYMKLVRQLNLDNLVDVPLIDPSLFMERFATKLPLPTPQSVHEVSQTAIRFVQAMNRDWICTGRRPTGLCGAALLLATRYHGHRIVASEISSVVRMGENTLKRRLFELRQTPLALMDRQQFELEDFTKPATEECFPPAMIMHARREHQEAIAWEREQELIALEEAEREVAGEVPLLQLEDGVVEEEEMKAIADGPLELSDGPKTPGMLAQPPTPGMLVQPPTPGLLGQPPTPGLLGQPQTPGLLSQPQTPGMLGPSSTPGLIPLPSTPGLVSGPRTPGLMGAPRTPGLQGGPGLVSGPRTPGWPGGSRTPGLVSTPQTPGLVSTCRTPGMQGGSHTPGLMSAPQTPALFLTARTPGLLAEHGGRPSVVIRHSRRARAAPVFGALGRKNRPMQRANGAPSNAAPSLQAATSGGEVQPIPAPNGVVGNAKTESGMKMQTQEEPSPCPTSLVPAGKRSTMSSGHAFPEGMNLELTDETELEKLVEHLEKTIKPREQHADLFKTREPLEEGDTMDELFGKAPTPSESAHMLPGNASLVCTDAQLALVPKTDVQQEPASGSDADLAATQPADANRASLSAPVELTEANVKRVAEEAAAAATAYGATASGSGNVDEDTDNNHLEEGTPPPNPPHRTDPTAGFSVEFDTLSDVDSEDLDITAILTEEEMAAKRDVWNEVNKDYLEEMHLRDMQKKRKALEMLNSDGNQKYRRLEKTRATSLADASRIVMDSKAKSVFKEMPDSMMEELFS